MQATKTEISEIVNQIKAAKLRLREATGEAVLGTIQIGELLTSLRKAAGKPWGKVLGKLCYNERVARRYMSLAKTWWAHGGLEASRLHLELPADVMQLEWLCKLTRDQLKEVVREWSCRDRKRAEVVAKVKGILNVQNSPRPPRQSVDGVRKACQQLFMRLRTTVRKLDPAQLPAEQREQLWKELKAEIDAVRASLMGEMEGPPGAAETPPEGDARDGGLVGDAAGTDGHDEGERADGEGAQGDAEAEAGEGGSPGEQDEVEVAESESASESGEMSEDEGDGEVESREPGDSGSDHVRREKLKGSEGDEPTQPSGPPEPAPRSPRVVPKQFLRGAQPSRRPQPARR